MGELIKFPGSEPSAQGQDKSDNGLTVNALHKYAVIFSNIPIVVKLFDGWEPGPNQILKTFETIEEAITMSKTLLEAVNMLVLSSHAHPTENAAVLIDAGRNQVMLMEQLLNLSKG